MKWGTMSTHCFGVTSHRLVHGRYAIQVDDVLGTVQSACATPFGAERSVD